MSSLIIQLKRAGDVVLTTPIAAFLKKKNPEEKVDFLVDKAFAPLLQNNPAIDTVLTYNRDRPWRTLKQVRAQRYDTIFDFQSSPRSAVVVLASGAKTTVGYRVPFWGRVYRHVVKRPGGSTQAVEGKTTLIGAVLGQADVLPSQIVLTPQEQAWAQEQQKGSQGQGLVGLVPTHRHNSRRWPAESFAALAQKLIQAGYGVWLFWGPGELDYVESIQERVPEARVVPPTSLRQMAALLGRCDLVATNDNGPMHIAVAVGTPTVTIYGPTDPRCWNPGGSRHTVLQAAGLNCLGCNLNNCPFGHECMKGVTPDQVFVACRQLLSSASKAVPV